ncbi:hypothetical protein SAMN05421796_11416 [Chryseobacterium piscicola]|uniref:Uncharacterized protein n=1 Tax=Chryseobacterium piscicola TaxID=551459 RepID=A0A1N7PG27_9FLAO|nr:hypothetical protein [Chryseobacterium piscicola]PQA92075.1 hypothetical protein B0A70_11645 [Chryseobacterium piscicola]SIT09554.1 hypothetical protein SAMN05421796_11416 [Chryseobacterium piscicola]
MTTNNKNNASQTLFRFVSLRNPQLTETKDENLGFIHREDIQALKGLFDAAVKSDSGKTALSKFATMERQAEVFASSAFKTEKDIEINPNFSQTLKLGRKIAKKETLSSLEETSAKDLFNDTAKNEKLKKLWDNLIYQVVSQQDFYVKEAIIQMLKVYHYGKVCSMQSTPELVKINGEDLKAKALDAKVVLPVLLFGDGNVDGNIASNAFQVANSAVGEGIIGGDQLPANIQEKLKIEGDKISETALINLERNSLETLKSELEKTQKYYYKFKNKAYEAAYKVYQEQYQSTIDEYNRRLDAIEAQITEETPREEVEALYAELGELNVPPFVFEYRNELNFSDLKSKLSLDSLKMFVRMFTDSESNDLDFTKITVISDHIVQIDGEMISLDEEYDTFAEVFEKLSEEISSQTQKIFARSPLNEKLYGNIGGILIPIDNTGLDDSADTSRNYYLKANQSNGTMSFVTFYYQASSNAWGVASAKVTATTDLGAFEETYSNISISNNKVTFPPMLVNKYLKVIRSLKIRIFFNNGEEANVDLLGLMLENPYTGILYTERIKQETETPTNPGGELPANPGTTPKPGTFLPKNFGIKRLGIADYLKVVQSTHAYVPGEVTHIENVMAKEFKQKSTRRLRRSEIQTTTSKSTERESLSDTTSTSRNDLQSEVANVIQQETSAQAYFRYGGGQKSFEVGGNFAANNSKENSTRQAIAKSQEITEKATERILTKVAEERIEKIIEEFEENNAHGFDNRNGDKHVVGVYRWVDKKMKNQIYNYGKRTMFEFMIPEPAKLHRLATVFTKTASTLKEPIDPRKAEKPYNMPTSDAATKDLLQYWAQIYGVKLTDLPKENITDVSTLDDGSGAGDWEMRNYEIGVPTNYTCTNYSVHYLYKESRNKGKIRMNGSGDLTNHEGDLSYGANATQKFFIQANLYHISLLSLRITKYCKLSDDFMNAWKKENFDEIIKAYEVAYAEFLEKQKEAEEKANAEATEEEEKNKAKLSNFYREMERVIIKHNCIAFLLQDYLNINTLGRDLTNKAKTMKDFSIVLDENLDQYTALAKFLEQAFEWTIMDYTFYPYYWANRDEWQTMYLSESTDPLFRNFLQAGMARVIVTVNPGFEDAVQFFMTTGRIWNGGEVPVIGDPLYMSIVDEMREPVGLKQGKAWITTLPTSLNILQEDAAGLKTPTALPFTEENPEEFEVPGDLVTETEFSITNAQLNSGENRFIENIDIKNGYLQLTTDDSPREIVAQISMEAIKKELQ